MRTVSIKAALLSGVRPAYLRPHCGRHICIAAIALRHLHCIAAYLHYGIAAGIFAAGIFSVSLDISM